MDKLQNEIDIKKWLDSEKAQRDLCGSYLFCKYCDKSLPNPCASAYKSMKNANAAKPSVSKPVLSKPANKKVKKSSKYYRLTFEDKINRADDETRQVLQEIVDSIETDEIKDGDTIKYITDTVEGVYKNHENIEKHIAENIKEDWSISRISKIALAKSYAYVGVPTWSKTTFN